jgi:hypothetical protein
MARFGRSSASAPHRRHRAGPHPQGTAAKGAIAWWSLAALALFLVTVPILMFNQQHSGDRLKIRRELRKF